MRHKRFAIDQVTIGDRQVSVRYCDVLVAAEEGAIGLDWECLLSTNDEVQLARAEHRLCLSGAGRELRGDAILVRSDGIAHVFRGNGPLEGLAPDELAPDEQAPDEPGRSEPDEAPTGPDAGD